MSTSSSLAWERSPERDHPQFLASLSSPVPGNDLAASAAAGEAEPHAATEGSTTAPSVAAGGHVPDLSHP